MPAPYAAKNPYNDLLYGTDNLKPEIFNALVAHHGVRIKIEKTVVCPAYNSNVSQNRHNINCTLCENGFVHFEETECYGVFQQNMLNKMFMERGEFVPGQALLTIPSLKESQLVDISAYTVAQTARITSPVARVFLSSGTVGGTFTIGSITGLAVGQNIVIIDNNTSSITVRIRLISGAATPYTITVEESLTDNILVGLFDRITLLDEQERFYELLNKSAPQTISLTSYTVAQNARIVSPSVLFLTDGTAGGIFTVNSIAGLAEGQVISVIDNNTAALNHLIITDISGTASPYTITVQAENSIDILRYGAIAIEYVTTESRGVSNPFIEGTDYTITGGNIEWTSTGSRPTYNLVTGVGEAFTVSYVFRPVYRVLSAVHEGRYSQEQGITGKTMTRFCQMFLIRKDYYVKYTPQLAVNDEVPSDDPSEPTAGGW